ncbi:Cytosolic sulfotransferase [Actinidia chinensis var. chinensis]|uniref:Sulfotransferase n=1 Tax=Actinidia chinensis var. chinensis TaxID=1590841 RepID=A0A2R6QHB1_ACTCC|nr:Cytosolic sulfotransferase [Actinidia chinensis var. chinensis]
MPGSLNGQNASLSKNNKEESDENVEKDEESFQRYRERISTLPKEKGWKIFWYLYAYGLEGVMFAQEHFKARPLDVFLWSTPKSGTTWLKAIIFAIMKRTCYTNSTHPILTNNPHEIVPILEEELFGEPPVANVESLPSPRLFATHISYISLPMSVLSSGCRIVYICRNPKDVLVSMWYFVANLRDEAELFSLQEAFDLFSQGKSAFGPYWDHVLGAGLECPERVFFITYEEMKGDTLVHVKRLAKFLGKPFSLEEESKGVAEEIVEMCSFESLSNLEVNKNGSSKTGLKNSVYFREGKVGGWRNHLTTQMIESLDRVTKEKLPSIF